MVNSPTSPLELRHDLHDGAGYVLAAVTPDVIMLSLRDPYDGAACPAFDRASVRQLIDDLTLVSGLTPPAPQLGRAAALAGSAQVLFDRLRDLKRDNPAGADMIVAMILADLRSWEPVTLLTAQVSP